MGKPTDKQYVNAAQRLHHDEGTLEVDDAATVSHGAEDGAYVQAWVWVPTYEARKERP